MSGTQEQKVKILWLLENIALNSQQDLISLVTSNILKYIRTACYYQDQKIRTEAQWVMATVVKLAEDHPDLQYNLVQQQELLVMFIDVLKDTRSPPEAVGAAIQALDCLFS